MPGPTRISPTELLERLGRPDAPLVLDVRTAEDAAKDPRLLPLARRAAHAEAAAMAPVLAGREVAVVCEQGRKLSEGAAAWLRVRGLRARALEGGFRAWAEAGLPLLAPAALPPRDAEGRSLWVTRARPKVDRIACPWLIRRFLDPAAVFLFVAPEEVTAVAERFGATPFDVEGVFWSHRGPLCTFDVMVEEFGLRLPALDHLARLVRGADTGALGLEPECAGLLAASLGLSRMHGEDLAQLDAGLALYDAFWRWCREAAGETHNWPAARTPA